MTIQEVINKMDADERVRIINNGVDVFIGYVFTAKNKPLPVAADQTEIKKIYTMQDITRRNWAGLKVKPPLSEDIPAQVNFKDMQIVTYLCIEY